MYWSQVRVLAGPPKVRIVKYLMKTIICTTPIDHLRGLKDILKNKGRLIYKPNIKAAELKKILKNNNKINIIFCNPNRQGYILNKSILENSSIKLINTASTGLNHINLKDCKKLGIKILSLTKDFNLIKQLPSTSELSFGLMINLQRKIFQSFKSVLNKKWDYTSFIGQELASLTIGIIGLGRLGNFMAKYAKAFGMKVFYHDPFKENKNFKKTNLKKLIEISDVISIHAHVNEQTKYIINKKNLKLAKKKPIIINTSRGELVKEEDIIWALKNKLISGYGADVIEKEFINIKKSPIIKNIKNYNIIVTPHIGGMTYQGQLRAYTFAINKFK
jgi:D-3-phosphoglycerate dehydrogenase / 2-oxoglutarate reductase